MNAIHVLVPSLQSTRMSGLLKSIPAIPESCKRRLHQLQPVSDLFTGCIARLNLIYSQSPKMHYDLFLMLGYEKKKQQIM